MLPFHTARYKLAREEQDAFAAESQRRASVAQKGGLFDDEIIPVTVTVKDKEGHEKVLILSVVFIPHMTLTR